MLIPSFTLLLAVFPLSSHVLVDTYRPENNTLPLTPFSSFPQESQLLRIPEEGDPLGTTSTTFSVSHDVRPSRLGDEHEVMMQEPVYGVGADPGGCR